jgi:predicted RNA binding protein YcfA (HicA-like mRNA interferase family)
MSRIPRVTGSDLVTALLPAHSGETIGPGLLHKILRDCQLKVEEVQALL